MLSSRLLLQSANCVCSKPLISCLLAAVDVSGTAGVVMPLVWIFLQELVSASEWAVLSNGWWLKYTTWVQSQLGISQA